MNKYEKLLDEYDEALDISEHSMKNKGLYADDVIWIKKDMNTSEKACILAEELGHYHTTAGDILDQSDTGNVKQELKARAWAYDKLIPMELLQRAFGACRGNRYEMANLLDVEESFLQQCIEYYEGKNGPDCLTKNTSKLVTILERLATED